VHKPRLFRRGLVAVQPYGRAFAATAPRPIGEQVFAHWGQACLPRSWLVRVGAISGAFSSLSQSDPTCTLSGFAGGDASAAATHFRDSAKRLSRPSNQQCQRALCWAASAVPILRHVKYFTYGDTIGNVRAARVASAPGADVVTPAVVPDRREVASIAIMSVSKTVPPARIGALVYETTCPWATVCPMANIKMPAGFPARFGAFASY
jgi:hypothetical protein